MYEFDLTFFNMNLECFDIFVKNNLYIIQQGGYIYDTVQSKWTSYRMHIFLTNLFKKLLVLCYIL